MLKDLSNPKELIEILKTDNNHKGARPRRLKFISRAALTALVAENQLTSQL